MPFLALFHPFEPQTVRSFSCEAWDGCGASGGQRIGRTKNWSELLLLLQIYVETIVYSDASKVNEK